MYQIRKLRHVFLSASGGVLLTAFLIAASAVATQSGAERLGGALFMLVFWTAGIFGAFFDRLLGMKSYWMPNGFGFLAAIVFDVIVLSILTCSVLWLIEQFRHAGDLDDV